jgi:hypothetical protein
VTYHAGAGLGRIKFDLDTIAILVLLIRARSVVCFVI